MTITIFGVTGRMQHLLVRLALDKGFSVIGYARTPSKMVIQHPRLILKKGTLHDRIAIEDAIKGSDAVIETVGSLSNGTANIVQAMKNLNVKRLIVVSTANVRDEQDLPDRRFACLLTITRIALRLIGLFNSQVYHAVTELRKAAEIVRNSNLDWTLVRVAALTNKSQSNKTKSGYLGRGVIGFETSRADMADFLLSQVTDTTYIRQAPAISS